MLTAIEIVEILSRIHYKDWLFRLGVAKSDYDVERAGPAFYLQLEFTDHEGVAWKGRKWILSRHMTTSEIVQTAFKAVLTAEEHEIRELFRFDGESVLAPHLDLEQLAIAMKQCGDAMLDVRATRLAVEAA